MYIDLLAYTALIQKFHVSTFKFAWFHMQVVDLEPFDQDNNNHLVFNSWGSLSCTSTFRMPTERYLHDLQANTDNTNMDKIN